MTPLFQGRAVFYMKFKREITGEKDWQDSTLQLTPSFVLGAPTYEYTIVKKKIKIFLLLYITP